MNEKPCIECGGGMQAVDTHYICAEPGVFSPCCDRLECIDCGYQETECGK